MAVAAGWVIGLSVIVGVGLTASVLFAFGWHVGARIWKAFKEHRL